MRRITTILLIVCVLCFPLISSPECQQSVRPVIDLAFCLDTTSSMSGLIEQAKVKIWLIINAVAKVKPTPVLRIAFVVYRDNGDNYVTEVHDFTPDIEGMYSQLRGFQAQGGGDGPEHVNKALNDAVNKLSWTNQSLKFLFLVGDAPPHMDYSDGFHYRNATAQARSKGIIVNAIQCGSDQETARVWKEISNLAGGIYAAIDYASQSVPINSPYDLELAKLSDDITGTYVRYGGSGRVNQRAQMKNDAVALSDPSAAADRAEAKSGALYKNENWDLVDAIQGKSLKIQDISEESLPPEMRGLTVAQIEEYVQDKARFRSELKQQIQKLSEKRKSYLNEEATKLDAKDSFDREVLKALKTQGEEKGVCF